MELGRRRPEGQGDVAALAVIPSGAGGEEHPVHREGIGVALPVHPVPGAVPRAVQRPPATMPAGQVQPFLVHYHFYQVDPSDHITAGYSVEC